VEYLIFFVFCLHLIIQIFIHILEKKFGTRTKHSLLRRKESAEAYHATQTLRQTPTDVLVPHTELWLFTQDV
jgi:hypothetical protein